MEYYVKESQSDAGTSKMAGVKARDDMDAILARENMKEINIPSNESQRQTANLLQRAEWHLKVKRTWKRELDFLREGDVLYLQFPLIEHSVFLIQVIKSLIARNVQVILIIHDLELLRVFRRKDVSILKRVRLKFEEKDILRYCSYIIAHNKKMIDYISEFGIEKNRIIDLGVFDYIIQDFDQARAEKRTLSRKEPVIIAGNLRFHKARYVYDLPDNCQFNLYGVGYEPSGKENIRYCGSFMPDDLPYELNGSFGLVWDGVSARTCEGVYGEYLRINNPHKTSLYLAAGVPVIIWREAALAEFVQQNRCGILVDSLRDIAACLSQITDEEYQHMKENAEHIGARLRTGYYTKRAIAQCR